MHPNHLHHLAELCWRSLMTLFYWKWHLIQRCHLRSIFARFPEQLLKDLVSRGRSGEYFIIDRFLGDAFGVLSYQFWSTVRQCGDRLLIQTLIKLLDRVVSHACFLTECVWVWHCTSSICGSFMYVVQDQVCPMHPLYAALSTWAVYVPVRVTLGALVAHRYTYALPRCRTSKYRRTFITL